MCFITSQHKNKYTAPFGKSHNYPTVVYHVYTQKYSEIHG